MVLLDKSLELVQIIGLSLCVYVAGALITAVLTGNVIAKVKVGLGYTLFWPIAAVVFVILCFIAFVEDLMDRRI